MALETPNATVASGVLLYDTALALADQITLRSSNGVKRRLDTFMAPGPATAAVWELEHPVDNDEAVVLFQPFMFAPGLVPIFMIFFVTPASQQTGIPVVDGLPANVLATAFAGAPPNTKIRASVAVQRLITTVQPIVGEPLP